VTHSIYLYIYVACLITYLLLPSRLLVDRCCIHALSAGECYSYSFYASRNILLVHKLKERRIAGGWLSPGSWCHCDSSGISATGCRLGHAWQVYGIYGMHPHMMYVCCDARLLMHHLLFYSRLPRKPAHYDIRSNIPSKLPGCECLFPADHTIRDWNYKSHSKASRNPVMPSNTR
jgi:hypothetical protein